MFGASGSSIQDMLNRLKINREMVKRHDYFIKKKEEYEKIHLTHQIEPLTNSSFHYNFKKSKKAQLYGHFITALPGLLLVLIITLILILN